MAAIRYSGAMRRFVLCALLAGNGGCGRLGFTTLTDDTSSADGGTDATACVAVGNDDDSDGIDDGCDPCPHVAGDRGDADRDGVGDACDPSAGAERFVLFDPFLGNAFDPRWSSNGPVTIGQSVARLDGRAGLPLLAYKTTPANTEIAITGTIVEIALGTQFLSLQFGDLVGADAEYCEVYGAPATELKITREVGTSFFGIAMTPITPLQPGPFTLRFRHSAAGFSCELTSGGQTYRAEGPGTYLVPRKLSYLQFQAFLVDVASFVELELAP